MPKTTSLSRTTRFKPSFTAAVRLRQVEDLTALWRKLLQTTPPRRGWLRMIREAMGMTTGQLADRLRIGQPRVVRIEKAEATGNITLKTLREAAHAMNCDLVYAVVPRKPIAQLREERATDIARKGLKRVIHSMGLEDQSPGASTEEELLRQRVHDLLAGPPMRLWDEKA